MRRARRSERHWRPACLGGRRTRIAPSEPTAASPRPSLHRVDSGPEVLALKGEGITCLPPYVVEEDIAAGRLVRRMLQYESLEMSVSAVCPSGRFLSTKVRAFEDFVAAQLDRTLASRPLGLVPEAAAPSHSPVGPEFAQAWTKRHNACSAADKLRATPATLVANPQHPPPNRGVWRRDPTQLLSLRVNCPRIRIMERGLRWASIASS
jgi:LysR substrate binding domain